MADETYAVEEVVVENTVDVTTEETNGDSTVEPAYIMEVEVNAEGEVINQTEKIQQESIEDNIVFVEDYNGSSANNVKSTNNSLHQVGNSDFVPTAVSNDVEVATTATANTATQAVIDQRLLENLLKGNGNVSVIQESGQVIIVLGQDSTMSQGDLEAIKRQITRNEMKDRGQKCVQNTAQAPIAEPSCFTEQSSENSSYNVKAEEVNEVHVCYQCKGEFNSAAELVHHFVQAHSTSVQCQHCDSVFPSIAEANQHKKQRHVEFQCTMCKKKYYGTISLNQHIKLRHSKSSKCGSCYQYFDSREEMEEHVEKVHKHHKCFFCGKGFYFETSLDNHIESEHGFSKFDHLEKQEYSSSETKRNTQHQDTVPENVAQKTEPTPKFEESLALKSQSKSVKLANTKLNKSPDINGSRKSPRRNVHKSGNKSVGPPTTNTQSKDNQRSTVDTSAVNDLLGHNTDVKLEHQHQGLSIKLEEKNDQKLNNSKRRSSRGLNDKVPKIKVEEPEEKRVNGVSHTPLRKSPRKRTADESPNRPKKSNQTKCDIDYKTDRGLLSHIKSEHSKSSNLPVCEYCSEEFRTQRTFALHKKDNWKRCSVANACANCSEVFTSTRELTSHHKRTHKGKALTYK